jgi:dephospho-CoA kinase
MRTSDPELQSFSGSEVGSATMNGGEFGLTGGIGSGKSTVANGLVIRGAALIDADQIVRELQAPGSAVLAEMTEAFGPGILTQDGSLDRAAVAAVVFGDESLMKRLNEIVHPPVIAEMAARRKRFSEEGRIVVLDIPLLVLPDGQKGRKDYDTFVGIIVVDVDPEVAVSRLVEHRGFTEEDARARMAAQATREQRLAVADFVIDNSGTLADLGPQLDACWEWMSGG